MIALLFSYYIWDLATESATFTVWGADSADFMRRVASGDFNGDGMDDIIAAADYADGPGNSRPDCGEVYVIFGRPGLSGTWDLASQPPDYLIYGPQDSLRLGFSLVVEDVDCNGCDDILVTDERKHAYLIYGSDTLTGERDLAVDSADYFVDATGYALNYFGENLEILDVNNDSLPDMVFRDMSNSPYFQQGKVDIIFNDGNLVGTRIFTSDPPDAIIWGPGPGSDLSGFYREIWKGDADSDGVPELFLALCYNGSMWPERGYIIYQVNPGNNYLEACAGYRIYPEVKSGKPEGLNPEVFPDLLLLCFDLEGIYGTSTSPFYGTRDLDAQPSDFQILGHVNYWEVSDFNRDGWAEIIKAHPEEGPGGKVQVFSLWRHPTGEWDPDVDTADVVILNDGVGGYFGTRVATGDCNDDGHPDLLVAETRETSPGGTPLVGAVYVFDLHFLIDTYETEPREFPLFSLYPSITKGDLTLQFSLNSDQKVSLRIFDLSGRVAQLQDFGKLPKGRHRITIDLRGLSQGVYVLELKRGETRTRRVLALLR